jgi:hypothetical protein
LVLLLSMVFACHSEPPVAGEPAWGKQPCEQCGAVLNDPRAAAQALLSDDSRKFFDDVGCLARWLDVSGKKPTKIWAKSADGERWVDAATVRYAAGFRTPQGYGFLSADKGLSFRDLRIVARARPDSPMRAAP